MSWLQPDLGPGVRALISKREHPRGEIRSEFNVATHAGPQVDVAVNRATVAAYLGAQSVQWLEQIHGADVRYVDLTQPSHLVCDATWTDRRGVGLAIMTADCVPVLIADQAATVIGAAHAGWQGVQAKVVSALVQALPVAPNTLKAYIGPAISAQHYEVGAEVWERFPAEFLGMHSDQNKRFLDLAGMVVAELKALGVPNVETSGVCCFTDEAYYSYRASMQNGRAAGRFVSAISLV